MKRIALTLCVLLALVTASNAACYNCKTSKGTLFTDNPPQDAECEWLGRCSKTYSEEQQRASKAKDALYDQATAIRYQKEEADKNRNIAEIQRRNDRSNSEQREREIQGKQNELNSMVKRLAPGKLNDYMKQVNEIANKKGEIDRLSNQNPNLSSKLTL